MKLDVKEFEGKMQKTLTAYEKELESIRLGRANPVVLNKITVDYYGCPTQISQMAEVKTTDARTLMITPWDATTLRSIEKAINESDLGINPQNDGKSIRLAFPPMTGETRKVKKNIMDISLDVGFSSVSYFNRVFRKVKGCTPSAYKKAQNADV